MSEPGKTELFLFRKPLCYAAAILELMDLMFRLPNQALGQAFPQEQIDLLDEMTDAFYAYFKENRAEIIADKVSHTIISLSQAPMAYAEALLALVQTAFQCKRFSPIQEAMDMVLELVRNFVRCAEKEGGAV